MNSILITGGSGGFGQAFVRFLLEHTTIQRICVFSRGELAQAMMRERLKPYDNGRLRFFIGDVRDKDRLRHAMQGVDAVIHAAALKRIEVGAYNPSEMVLTNVLGAMNVIDAATDARVSKVVMLSTDKAFQPISPYGQSKALAESLFLAANNTRSATGPCFAVTRYGNVAGSPGSVIPKWRALMEEGMTSLPVTDPECTRFYMTMDEAITLVWATVQVMEGGELVVPRYLPAYRLGDLAEALGATMQVSGLPEWEKRHEGMDFGCTSDLARRMSIDELKEAIASV